MNPLNIKHAVPGITLLKRNGYFQVRKTGLTRQRVKTDPAFKKTRQQAAEFTTVVKLTKNICDALLTGTGIKNATRRLNSIISKTIQTDRVSFPGHRSLLNSNWQILEGFDYNASHRFKDVTTLSYDWRYNMTTEEINLQIADCIPVEQMILPPEVTHYRIKSCIISIDVKNNVKQGPWQQSSRFPVKRIKIPVHKMTHKIDVVHPYLHMIIIYIQWYKIAQNERNRECNQMPGPMTIAGLYKPVQISLTNGHHTIT